MVISTLITSLMKKFLSPFVEDFNAEQLNLFGWSGQLTISEVNIKPNAFDALKLPFRVVQGHIGKIEAEVPWMNIYTEPIIIKINDIFALVVPNTDTSYNEAEEKDYEWQLKKSYLENIEIIKQKIEKDQDSSKKIEDDGFVMKLLSAAIKNIQIFIDNVHICYEDNFSGLSSFQIGLGFSKLIFKTENTASENSQDSNSLDTIIKKIVKLEGFSFYLNHSNFTKFHGRDRKFILSSMGKLFKQDNTINFILCPIKFENVAKIDRKPEATNYQYPIVELDMKLEEFQIRLDNKQIKSILILLDALDRIKVASLYRKWRPKIPIKENPTLWWKFLYEALAETGIRRRKREFSWENIELACKRRKAYVDLYKRKLLGQKVDQELEELEKSLNLVVIVMSRAQAEISTQKILKEMEKEKSKGWFKGWWSSAEKKEDAEIESLRKEFTQGEEKAKLYKSIGYEEGAIPNILYPPEYIAHKVHFRIDRFKIILKNEIETISMITLNNLTFDLKNRPSSQNMVLGAAIDSINFTGVNDVFMMKSSVVEKFINFSFELNPLDKQCDFSVALESKSQYFLYDIDTVQNLIKMFSPPDDINLEEIKNAAQYKFDDLRLVTYSQVQNAIQKHKQLRLTIKLEPSFVIVPEKGHLKSAKHLLLISLGEFKMQSKLVPKSNAQKLSDECSREEIMEMIYERYTINVKNVQVILSDPQRWEADIKQLDTDRHILCPFEIVINFKRSIISTDPRYPKIDLDGQIPSIELKASSTQIKNILALLMKMPFGDSESNRSKITSAATETIDSKLSTQQISKIKSNLVTDEVIDAMNYAAKTIKELKKSQLLKENESKEMTDGKDSIIAYKEVIFGFKLMKILVTLYQNDRQETSKLTLFQLIGFSIYGELLSDQTLWVNLCIDNLKIDDIRSQRKQTGLFTILSKAHQVDPVNKEEKPMLSIYMAQKSVERVIIVSISGLSLILAVDYILSLVDIATKAFLMEPNTSKESVLSVESLKRSQFQSSISANKQPIISTIASSVEIKRNRMMIECSMDKLEVVMIESIENSDCDAMIFHCTQKINLKIEEDIMILGGIISKINMALTNYSSYIDSGRLDLYIMAPTDLTINGSIKGATQMLDFAFDDIYINISPSMLQIMLKIFAGMGRSSAQKPNELLETADTINLLEPRQIDGKEWYLNYAPQAKEALSLLNTIETTQQKSNLIFNVNKIKILIKSGGVEAHPLIRIELSTFARLIDGKNFNFECSILSDYYNHSLSAWEPLIEPVDDKPFAFRGNVLLGDHIKIQLMTVENLEFLITKSSVNIFHNIAEAFSRVISANTFQAQELNRITIRNQLGCNIKMLLTKSNVSFVDDDLNLMITKSSNNPDSTNNRKNIHLNELMLISGKEYTFECLDPNDVKLSINILFTDSVIVERTIICQKTSTRCYFTSIKSYPVDENWKFIVQVFDKGTTKEILFRSTTQILNEFDNSFQLFSCSNRRTIKLGNIEPHSTYYLPTPIVYGHSTLYVTPSDEYELCVPPFLWRETKEKGSKSKGSSCFFNCTGSGQQSKPYLILSCLNKNNNSKKFQVKLRGEKSFVSFEDTEKQENPESYIYSIRMIPLARLRNLLPSTLEYYYSPLNEKKVLNSGQDSNLPFIDFGRSVIKLHLKNYLNQDWVASQEIPESGQDLSVIYVNLISTIDRQNQLCLPLELKVENSLLLMTLYSTFWVINRTKEIIRLRVDEFHCYEFLNDSKRPQLFSFNPDKVSKKSKISLAIGSSEFSTDFPIDVAPFKVTLTPKTKQKYSYLIAVRVESSQIGMTKIISIEAFYSVINLTKKLIKFSENNEDWFRVDPNSLMPFYPKKLSNQSICFRIEDNDYDSKHISLRESSQTLLSIDKRFIYVEVDVTELESKIRISEYFDGSAPVLIVNCLDRPIFYGQHDVSNWTTKKHIRTLQPKHMAYFCWIDPYQTRKLVYKTSLQDEQEINVNIDFDSFTKFNEEYAWVSFLNGKQRVLLFTKDLTLPENLLMTHEFMKPDLTFELIVKGFGLNIVDDEKHLDLFYLSIKSTNIWESRAEDGRIFKPVSIKENETLEQMYQHFILIQKNSSASVIKSDHGDYEANFINMTLFKPRLAYLRRIANRGLWLNYSSSEHLKNFHLRINDIQIDNQLSDCVYNVVFSPVVVPKSVSDKFEIERKHFIEVCAIICPGSINRFKHLQILIQEFMLQIDLGWIFKIINVFDIKSANAITYKELIKNDLSYIEKYNSPSELEKYVANKSYYDYIMFGPLKLHLSLNISEANNDGTFFLLDFLIRFGGSVGEISDTLFKFDYFERKLQFLGQQEIVQQLIDHYKNQGLMQFYKIILGLDIIGNPMKLALGFKKGIGDFFYEPAAGIIHGPEEFAEGLATGVKSLASNVIGGTAGALSRIGSRLGTGVATLTADDKFQKDRRKRINRKLGFAESGKNLVKGIFSGITGIVTKPIEGAKEEGVEGLFKGVGKGVVGVFAQPATSVIDFASHQLQAFNYAIDPSQAAKPLRVARFFNNKEIKPYNRHKARGCHLFSSVSATKFLQDEYVDHAELTNNVVVVLTNHHILSLKQSFVSNQWDLNWHESWGNCEEPQQNENKIFIKLKTSKKTLNPLGSPKERIIVFNQNDHQIQNNLFQKILAMIKSDESIHSNHSK